MVGKLVRPLQAVAHHVGSLHHDRNLTRVVHDQALDHLVGRDHLDQMAAVSLAAAALLGPRRSPVQERHRREGDSRDQLEGVVRDPRAGHSLDLAEQCRHISDRVPDLVRMGTDIVGMRRIRTLHEVGSLGFV